MIDEPLTYFFLVRFSGGHGNPSKTLNHLFKLVLRVDPLELLSICIFYIFEATVFFFFF